MEKEGKQCFEPGVLKKFTGSMSREAMKRGESMRVEQSRQDGTGSRGLDARWALFEGESLHGALQRWKVNVR